MCMITNVFSTLGKRRRSKLPGPLTQLKRFSTSRKAYKGICYATIHLSSVLGRNYNFREFRIKLATIHLSSVLGRNYDFREFRIKLAPENKVGIINRQPAHTPDRGKIKIGRLYILVVTQDDGWTCQSPNEDASVYQGKHHRVVRDIALRVSFS